MDNEFLLRSIRNLCKENGITAAHLEKELSFGAGTISRWYKISPSINKVVDIADYFNISMDELIGRKLKTNNVTNEEFIDNLYNMTKSKILKWEEHTKMLPQLESDKNFNLEDDGFDNKELYVTSYKNGFFLLYCQYEEEKGNISDYDIQIYIRPDNKSKAVLQDSDDKKAYQLWLYIHTNTYGTLDEIKAEELKNNFVNNGSEKTTEVYTEEQLIQITQNMIKTEPNLLKAFELINDPDFVKLLEILESPRIQEGLKIAQILEPYARILQTHELGHFIAQKNTN